MFDFAAAMEYIDKRQRFGTKQGTARMEHIAEVSGLYSMIKDIKFIHIAGTNGKGSAAAMTASVLSEAGYRTGLYVSPFIHRFTERISVDGVLIGEDEFARCLDYFRPYIDKMDLEYYGDMKAFELITLAGLLYFAKKKCEYVCLEVGIGGRLDATNIINPHLALIMSISFDHTAQLGNTLQKIASEKCGIIKKGVPVVCYPDQKEEALREIIRQAKEKDAPLYVAEMPERVEPSENGTRFIYKGKEYALSLTGIHQGANAAAVLCVLERLRELSANIPEKAVEKGLLLARNPGRLEILGKDPLVIVDGAHNEGGAEALSKTLPLICKNKNIVFVLGMCDDHAKPEVLSKVLLKNSCVFTAKAKNTDRGMDPTALARLASSYCKEATAAESLAEALRLAKNKAGREGAVVCFGSLFIANEICEAAKEKN